MDGYLGEEKFEKFVKWKYSRNVEYAGRVIDRILLRDWKLNSSLIYKIVIFEAKGKIRWSYYLPAELKINEILLNKILDFGLKQEERAYWEMLCNLTRYNEILAQSWRYRLSKVSLESWEFFEIKFKTSICEMLCIYSWTECNLNIITKFNRRDTERTKNTSLQSLGP